MSAPPPPSAAGDYYEDEDDFDWEAAVIEIDKVHALNAASTSAPARVQHAPSPPPLRDPSVNAPPVCKPPAAAGSGARQSTLDRYINAPSIGVQREDKRPEPEPVAPALGGGGGHARVRDIPECSRQAGRNGFVDRFMESFSFAREANAPPAPPAQAPAPTAGGRKRPGPRAGKGCASRPVVQDVSYKPCAIAVDKKAMETWIYPTNVEYREYQKSMVEKALFTNTLVALPTGLGKTFIAAVVMYNYFRWFPEGKIVFTAPSRPLVTQQIEACHNTVGIPQEWTIDMKGNRTPISRSHLWETKRVFFVTPQVLENDIKKGTCKKEKIVCLVIDEAHRASGNYAYCTAVRELVAAQVPLRILALTATPGSKHADIQNVISNLCISDLVYCDEEDSEVRRYINKRKVDLVKVPIDNDVSEVDNLLLDIMHPRLSRLRGFGVIDHRDSAKWTPYGLLEYKGTFERAPPPNISEVDRDEILKDFLALGSILHVRKLLLSHGIKQAYQFLEDKLKKGSLRFMRKNEVFWKLKDKMKHISSQGSPRKIQELIHVVENHFKITDSKESRIIVFSHFRGSVKEIYLSLQSIDDRLIRPVEFIGQSTAGKRLKGQSQKMQQAILKKFRSGEYNVLVATSIGEEGLDIIEVDLVICFDANVSPLRMIQRMGRTGRKHEGRVVVLACEGQEDRGYSKKQVDTRTMRKLLRNSERFEYHASPRMVPHAFQPEIDFMKLEIAKYIPGLKKTKDTVNGASPILKKMSEEDGRLFAQYFSASREDMWKPSLVAFPRFQLSPSIVHKVPHSFRTTDMLIDAMQHLRDVSFTTKSESPFQEPTCVTPVKEAHEGLGLNAINGSQEATVQECDGLEASSREIVWNENVCLPGSLAKTYPVHSFFNGQYITVDRGGNVSITFVPVLPHTSACRKDTKNASLCCSIQEMVVGSKSAADFSKQTAESDCVAYGTNSGKQMLINNASNLTPHSCECAGQDDNVDEVITTPSETSTSPRDEWDTPFNARLESSAFFRPEDTELSPRLSRYMEEGTVPESPVLDASPLQEPGGAVDAGLVPSLKPLGVGMQAGAAGYQKEPLLHEKNDGCLDRTQALAEEPARTSNGKLCTPSTHISTNLLCDSFSNDFQLKSGGDTSGSDQKAPKYRRLCKYGDKIKKVSSNSLDDEFEGNKGKAKRRLDTYIDEEVEVSEDADVSEDEDGDQSEDRYEDSFIDDQETPTGEFTETEQGDGNNRDMMGFYRQSLLTQTPVVLPSRYLDASDSSVSNRTSSETGHNSVAKVKTPIGPCPTHHIMDSSPSWYRQRSMEGTSAIQQQTETTIGNCESSSNMNGRKRKLSFQQPLSIPVINLELEPTPKHSVHLANGTTDDLHMDDAFFEGLDLDAIEAQATEKWKQKTTQLTQIQAEPKKASEISFDPPSFDLGL